MASGCEPQRKVTRDFGIDGDGTGDASLLRGIGTPPGGTLRRPRLAEYAGQLTEQQKMEAIYGVSEGQLRRYHAEVVRRPGAPGTNGLQLLERRLDNVVYRLGFARNRLTARWLVSHRHVRVNGRDVDDPAYLVEPAETIELDRTAAQRLAVVEEQVPGRLPPDWLERAGTVGRVVRLPRGDDVDRSIDEELVAELESRQ